ncbi:MAG: hypothetical protein L6R38_000866 [Xanthoria sp. 2 TBL-2021]|nr:MAG: hypothetical protein L6R38_000866 [Xanthoria sp. 2 TBL-2021]
MPKLIRHPLFFRTRRDATETPMETAIRWSPSSDIQEQRFLLVDVTGRSFSHCKVRSYDGKDLKYETLCGNRRAPPFRAFDWSPHDESIVAVGDISGSATVIRLDDSQTSPLTLPVRQQRPCNAVAFSKAGLLATGLERVRNDFCLNIWDVSRRLSENPSIVSSPGRSSLEPIRKLASSEAITSIRFFLGQPDTFAAGVKGTCIRLYDLRENAGNGPLQFQTASVHNLAIDPLDENYFASAVTQKDTTIQIWDRRFAFPSSAASLGSGTSQSAPLGPVLEYTNAFESSTSTAQSNIWSLRYCKGKSGYLGALASNGDFRVFETKQAYHSGENDSQDQGTHAQGVQVQTERHLRTKRIHHVGPFLETGRPDNACIVSFDFTNLAGLKGMPSAVTLRGTGSVEVYELKGRAPPYALSSDGELVGSGIAGELEPQSPTKDGSLAQVGLFHVKASTNEPTNELANRFEGMDISHQPNGDKISKATISKQDSKQLSSCEMHEKWFENRYVHHVPSVAAALATLTVDRRRCIEGYLFDCGKNMEIAGDDSWLKEMWDWVGRAKRLANAETFIVRGIDLNYLGVWNIWNIDLGSEKAARISGRSGNTEILYAIEAICRSLDLPELSHIESSLPAHRRLSLYLCGFGLSGEEMDVAVSDLANRGRNTEAAFLALIDDDPKQAANVLRNGSHLADRELSLALAGYIRGITDDTWCETIQNIATSLTDPYARGILALVRNGSWHDVLHETSLPLKFRVGIALMHLADDDLTTYITTTTNGCTHHGDIEGIVLTGLSSKAVPLFQNYILKYHDLQTAILAISHTSPRYFPSPLVDTWRAEYRTRLNTYRLFLHRVRFDTGATKLSVASGNNGKPSLAPPARQVSLKCGNCEQAMDQNPAHVAITAPPPPPVSFTSSADQNRSIFSDDVKTGTACPKCGKHLPRCVVCMLWLGMPDPHTKGGEHANVAAMERSKELQNAGKGERGRMLMKDFICVCRGCWHMMHVGHAEEWFRGNRTCPVPGCECACGERDGGFGRMG